MCIERVDRQPDVLAAGWLAGALDEDRQGVPGVLPIVGRAGRQELRILDASHPVGGDQQKLGVAANVLQHRVAAGKVHLAAWGWTAADLGVGDTEVVHNVPERVRVGGAGPRGSDAGERRENGRAGSQCAWEVGFLLHRSPY
jgi:hypothetical protein